MIKFSRWMENLQADNAGSVAVQKQLGSASQDIVSAIDLVAKDPNSSSVVNGIFNNLSRLVAKQDANLASRLATGAKKFANASKHAGNQQPLGNNAGQQNTNDPPIRSAQ